jgi:hypothetical protein
VAAQRQINIRMADEAVSVLEAAAFLKRDTLPDLVRAVLLDYVTELERQPRVREMLRLRAEEEAAEAGVLTPIGSKRGGKAAS